jgi:serine/threonine-protein kinase
MAPEQFQGKAVFASDIYSLGVTMYQMLTGVLPYDTPAPADLQKLMAGELVSSPRLKNPAIPKSVADIVLRAMAADVSARYQRACDLLNDLLATRPAPVKRGARGGSRLESPADSVMRAPREDAQSIQSRVRAREAVHGRFCWNCRKPLHARTDRCPFCGESQ